MKNPLILHRIFKNFPTKLLLSSCSFVNAIWSRETRKFNRDFRKCTAVFAGTASSPFSTGQQLQKWDQLCIAMIQEGRVILWNGLCADFSYCSQRCLERFQGQVIHCNLPIDFKLKYLEIVLPPFPRGSSTHHLPLVLLLLHDIGAELKSLTVSWGAFYFQHDPAGCTYEHELGQKMMRMNLMALLYSCNKND